mgnify:CR=1 FL=1
MQRVSVNHPDSNNLPPLLPLMNDALGDYATTFNEKTTPILMQKYMQVKSIVALA